ADSLRTALLQALSSPNKADHSRTVLKVGAVAAFSLIAIAVGIVWPRPTQVRAASTNKILVVLPCEASQSGAASDPGERAYCDGVVETLSSRLGQLSGIAVVPVREVRHRRVRTFKNA